MPLNIGAILDPIVSHALASGLFERVNRHEAVNAPGHGLTASAWFDRIGPVDSGSGLASTSVRVAFNVRIYSPAAREPADEIDPHAIAATDALMNAYSGDFELGGQVRCVDLLGMHGEPLSARSGWLGLSERLFRVVTIVLPVIVSDVWAQQP